MPKGSASVRRGYPNPAAPARPAICNPEPPVAPRRRNMPEQQTKEPVPTNPVEDVLSGGPCGEVLGCPTGLSGLAPEPPPKTGKAAPAPPDAEEREGRQETGRDNQGGAG